MSYVYNLIYTHMRNSKRKKRDEDPKAKSLRDSGGLHNHPEKVQDGVFKGHEFFDARDRMQVRYEMLRRHRVEGLSITVAARSFGVSRQSFYVTESSFESRGLPGLLPQRRGPKHAHKCSEEILHFVDQWHSTGADNEKLVEAIERRFGVKINARSIGRALARRKKKRNPNGRQRSER